MSGNIHRAHLAAELCIAADFYQLKGLQDKAISKTKKWLRAVATNEGMSVDIRNRPNKFSWMVR